MIQKKLSQPTRLATGGTMSARLWRVRSRDGDDAAAGRSGRANTSGRVVAGHHSRPIATTPSAPAISTYLVLSHGKVASVHPATNQGRARADSPASARVTAV